MPHIGPVLEGRAFFCPHCGALYSATPSLVPKSEGDTAKCVVCLKSWTAWMQPQFQALSSSNDLKMPEHIILRRDARKCEDWSGFPLCRSPPSAGGQARLTRHNAGPGLDQSGVQTAQ
jgi:hypothetical protein